MHKSNVRLISHIQLWFKQEYNKRTKILIFKETYFEVESKKENVSISIFHKLAEGKVSSQFSVNTSTHYGLDKAHETVDC